jgi:hypothetical protein
VPRFIWLPRNNLPKPEGLSGKINCTHLHYSNATRSRSVAGQRVTDFSGATLATQAL